MTLSFRYKLVKRPDGTDSRTPSIPIILTGKDSKFDAIVLIDSGADISAISKDMAEILELNLSGERDFAFGIGGKVEAVESKMSLAIEKAHEHYELTIPVKVILGDYDFPILLGRAGFFDEFIITFNQKEQKIFLKKTESNIVY